jgi:hypothetical protein
MTLYLTRSRRLWRFQLLGFKVFQVQLQKSHFTTVSIESKNYRDKKKVPSKKLSQSKSSNI